MFDLFRSRDKSIRILLGALLVLVALSMLTYLIPNYDTGGSRGDLVLAEVGDQAVTTIEVQRLVQNAVRTKQVPSEALATFVPQMIDEMITARAMAYQAARMGYKVSDAELAQAIQIMIPQLFQDGKFAGKEAYAALLAQQNITIPEFEAEVKRQVLATRLRSIAVEGVLVTPIEIEHEFRRRAEKIKVEYIKLSNDKVRAEIRPTPEQVKAYYQANLARYQVPEKRSMAILVADQARLEKIVQANDADLQRLYEQNKDRFRTPERVKVRHILLKTLGKAADQDAKMRAKAEALLKQIQGGADFAKLAKENSEDTGSAASGGELPMWVTRGQTVPEFEKNAFSLPVGKTSDVVKTQYGYHIMQVLKKEEAHLRSFEEAKTELAAEWKKVRVNEMMQQASDNAAAALQKDPARPEKVAADFNMQLVRVERASAGDPLPEIGVSRELEEAAASLKKGEVSQPVALGNNRIAVVLVTEVVPARPSTFEEVESKVREAYIASQVEPLSLRRATELFDKAKSLNGDLAAAAKAMGLEVKVSEEFTRSGAVEGLGSAKYFGDAFGKAVGQLAGPLPFPDGRVVAKVVSRSDGDLSQLPAQAASIRDELKSRKARERGVLFEDGLRQMLVKEGKIKIHKDVISRLTANYRG